MWILLANCKTERDPELPYRDSELDILIRQQYPCGGKFRRGEGGRVDVVWAFMVTPVTFVPLKNADPVE
jgi:hypothetical protein